jgi:hypothetical protein
MPMACAPKLLLCAAATVVAGCTGSTLSPDPPAVSLAGAWKLDHAASDDPQKLLERMRAEAYKRMSRRVVSSAPRPNTRSGAARGQQQPEDQPTEQQDVIMAPAAPGPGRPDPLRRSPMAHVILARIARGDFLTVRQAPGKFVLDYGNSQRSFTPGERSVVSAEGGVGDQTSGWKGREYVVSLRAQSGPDVTERYGLAADGKHLVEKIHIGAEELSAVDLTRVYDPTDETAPRQLPNTD